MHVCVQQASLLQEDSDLCIPSRELLVPGEGLTLYSTVTGSFYKTDSLVKKIIQQ